ncbi:MAG: MipA/OmpV family protein [Pseudomonadota bacterium]
MVTGLATAIAAGPAQPQESAPVIIADGQVMMPADEKAPEFRTWRDGFSLAIGAGVLVEPDYEGSSDFTFLPIPYVSLQYRDWFELDPTGASVRLSKWNGFALEGQVGYDLGRDEDDADILRGLGNIDFGVTVAGRASYEIGPLEAFASLQRIIGGSDGLIGEIGAELSQPVTEALILSVEASASFADDAYMDAYFSVNSLQSARSGLRTFDAGAGLKRIDLSAAALYSFNEHWFVRGEAGIGLLTGDAADSPIVDSDFQPSASLFIGYRF